MVATAAELADREGLDAVTLTRVARELGVRQPALYRHVDSYDGLIRLLGLRCRALLADRLADAAMGVAGDDAVRALGRAWRELVQESPGLYAATDRYPCTGDIELEVSVERIVEIIARSLSGYELSDDDRVHSARSMRSAFHGFAHLESGDGYPGPMNLDDSFEHFLDFLCAGVRATANETLTSAPLPVEKAS